MLLTQDDRWLRRGGGFIPEWACVGDFGPFKDTRETERMIARVQCSLLFNRFHKADATL